MAGAEFTIAVAPLPARADDSAPLTLAAGADRARRLTTASTQVEFGFAAHRGGSAAAAEQERVRR